jgi:hypothetical protein
MKIDITEDTPLGNVQAGFNYFFPSYRLEFFRGQPGPCERVHALESNQKIGEITYTLQEGSINLSDGLTVAELEEIFNDRFGLHVHVFRKTDNAPIAIPIAGDYPLRQSCN